MKPSSQPPTNILLISPISFIKSIFFQPGELIIFLALICYAIVSPFNKVEESFQTQAIHDLLFHQGNINRYDHFEYPGVVPRSFIGPIIVAVPTYVLHLFLFNFQQFSSLFVVLFSNLYSIIFTPIIPPHIDAILTTLVGSIFSTFHALLPHLPAGLGSLLDLPPPVYPTFLPKIDYLYSFFEKKLLMSTDGDDIIYHYHDWIGPLTISRCVMATYTAISLIILTRSIKHRFGKISSWTFLFFVYTQFHTVFYGSRVLANSFALQLVTIIFALLLQLFRIDKNRANVDKRKNLDNDDDPNVEQLNPVTHLKFKMLSIIPITFSVQTLIVMLFGATITFYRCDMLLYIATTGLCYCILYPVWNTIVDFLNKDNKREDKEKKTQKSEENKPNNGTDNNPDFSPSKYTTLPTLPFFSTIIIAVLSLIPMIILSVIIDGYFWAPYRDITKETLIQKCPEMIQKFNLVDNVNFSCQIYSTFSSKNLQDLIPLFFNNPAYILPYFSTFRPFWPELQVLLFNTVTDRSSSEWGVSPWHWYFSSALPRLLLTGFFIFPLAYFSPLPIPISPSKSQKSPSSPDQANVLTVNTPANTKSTEFDKLIDKMENKVAEKKNQQNLVKSGQNGKDINQFAARPNAILFSYTIPIWLFISLYSILPHKELRFILPVIPSLLIVPALGAAVLVGHFSAFFTIFNQNQPDEENDDDFRSPLEEYNQECKYSNNNNNNNNNDKKACKHKQGQMDVSLFPSSDGSDEIVLSEQRRQTLKKIEKEKKRKKSGKKRLTLLTISQLICFLSSCLISAIVSSGMAGISILNYPGGSAMGIANQMGLFHLNELKYFYHPLPHKTTIHIDNAAAMTGASRFTELKVYQVVPQSGFMGMPNEIGKIGLEVIKRDFWDSFAVLKEAVPQIETFVDKFKNNEQIREFFSRVSFLNYLFNVDDSILAQPSEETIRVVEAIAHRRYLDDENRYEHDDDEEEEEAKSGRQNNKRGQHNDQNDQHKNRLPHEPYEVHPGEEIYILAPFIQAYVVFDNDGKYEHLHPQNKQRSVGKNKNNTIDFPKPTQIIKYSKQEGLDPYAFQAEKQYASFDVLILGHEAQITDFELVDSILGFEQFSKKFPFIHLENKLFIAKRSVTYFVGDYNDMDYLGNEEEIYQFD